MSNNQDDPTCLPIVPWDAKIEYIGGAQQFLNEDDLQSSFEAYLENRRDPQSEIEYYTAHGSWRENSFDNLPDDKYSESMRTLQIGSQINPTSKPDRVETGVNVR